MPVLRLRSIVGGRRGQDRVFSGPRVRIGRSRDNDLILPERDNPSSSSRHAEALLDTIGAWWLVDIGSSNGTRVNDATVLRCALKNGDRITFGDETFVVAIGVSRGPWVVAGGAAIALIAVAGVLVVAFGMTRSRRTPFQDVAVSAAPSVFLIAVEDGGARSGVGTGFVGRANGPRRQAGVLRPPTRRMLEARGALQTSSRRSSASSTSSTSSPGRRAVAIQSDTFVARRIVAAVIAPEWHAGSLRQDVALLRLEPGPALTPPAGSIRTAAVAELARGTPVAAFGFPASGNDRRGDIRAGRVSVDVVGDARGEYLEVGLGIAPGTSGSPVFDASGVVVGIVAGGDFVGRPRSNRPRPTGSVRQLGADGASRSRIDSLGPAEAGLRRTSRARRTSRTLRTISSLRGEGLSRLIHNIARDESALSPPRAPLPNLVNRRSRSLAGGIDTHASIFVRRLTTHRSIE